MNFEQYNEFRNIKERNKKLIIVAVPPEYAEVFQVLKNDLKSMIDIVESMAEEDKLA